MPSSAVSRRPGKPRQASVVFCAVPTDEIPTRDHVAADPAIYCNRRRHPPPVSCQRTRQTEPAMTAITLSPATAVLLLVDHQTGVFDRVVKSPPREQVETNVVRLARAAALLDIPAILTTSEEEGDNGPLLPALETILPEAYAARIDRHGVIDSLSDPAVTDALNATHRRQLITAGIGTEVCGVAPALHARRDGYEVVFVADACGSATALGHEISLRRLEHADVEVTTTASVVSELAGTYPIHAQIMRG
jgi:nicotinamidase-related amidase